MRGVAGFVELPVTRVVARDGWRLDAAGHHGANPEGTPRARPSPRSDGRARPRYRKGAVRRDVRVAAADRGGTGVVHSSAVHSPRIDLFAVAPLRDTEPMTTTKHTATAAAVLEPHRAELEDALPHGAGQVPGLAAALVAAQAIDRAVAHLVETLLALDEHQVAETITGIPLEQWLAIVGRRTRSDRRMLLTACDALRRLPTLRTAFLDEATVSWAQARAIALAVERLPHHLDDLIDDALADSIPACRQDDPDSLVGVVGRALRSIEASAATPATSETPADTEDYVAMQPRLDGTGGRIHGELGAVGFATVDAALSPEPQDLGAGSGRIGGVAARARARMLVRLCDASLAGGDQPGSPHGSAPLADGDHPERSVGSGSRPQLLVRVELSTLLDDQAMPGELLTRLTGGKMWVDAATVRRLVDQRGADLRSVVLDETGRIVGVGRRTRVPPTWLRDAALALHDTCTAPGCLRPARSSDLDHARPWVSHQHRVPGGSTDVEQLGPLCRTHNRTKERAGWEVTRTADGVSRWRHPATGVASTTRPATWYPVKGQEPEPAAGGRWMPTAGPPSSQDAGGAGDPVGPDIARERRPVWDASRSPPLRPRRQSRTCG